MSCSSHFFLLNAEGELVAHPVSGGSLDFRALLLRGVVRGPAGPLAEAGAVHIVSFRAGATERWVVLAAPYADLRVNGVPLADIGMRVLADRDELTLAGVGSAFYSAESLAQVVPFPGGDRPIFCGRCREPIKPGAPAVQCPGKGCGIWYDQSEELPCFCYQPGCAYCGGPTALATGLLWVPEV
jgi:hypothetical protein